MFVSGTDPSPLTLFDLDTALRDGFLEELDGLEAWRFWEELEDLETGW